MEYLEYVDQAQEELRGSSFFQEYFLDGAASVVPFTCQVFVSFHY
jgi:hypothetical protein